MYLEEKSEKVKYPSGYVLCKAHTYLASPFWFKTFLFDTLIHD